MEPKPEAIQGPSSHPLGYQFVPYPTQRPSCQGHSCQTTIPTSHTWQGTTHLQLQLAGVLIFNADLLPKHLNVTLIVSSLLLLRLQLCLHCTQLRVLLGHLSFQAASGTVSLKGQQQLHQGVVSLQVPVGPPPGYMQCEAYSN